MGIFKGKGKYEIPFPLNGAFGYFCHHGQKYLAPAGATPSPCPPGGNKPSAKGYTLETIRPKALTGEKFMVYLQL